MPLHCNLVSTVSDKKLVNIHIFAPMHVKCSFSLAVFKILSLSIAFSSLIMMCQVVILFVSRVVHWIFRPLNCYSPNIGKCSPFKKYFFLPHSLFLFFGILQLHVYYYLTFTLRLCLFFKNNFSLFFQTGWFLWICIKVDILNLLYVTTVYIFHTKYYISKFFKFHLVLFLIILI